VPIPKRTISGIKPCEEHYVTAGKPNQLYKVQGRKCAILLINWYKSMLGNSITVASVKSTTALLQSMINK